MIYIVDDVFKPENHIKLPYKGQLIDFLQKRYPEGFSGSSAIYVNNELVPVEFYDLEVEATDMVVIIPNVPAGLETATIILLVNIAISLLSIALSYILAPKEPKRRGGKGRVYTIGSGQNVPALGEVIAEHYGKCWFYPDVASQPYSQYVVNEQYVYQILLIGAGEYRIDDIKIGDTQINMVPPGLVDFRLYGPADHKAQYGTIQADFNIYEDVVTSGDVQGISFTKNPATSVAGSSESWGIQVGETIYGIYPGDTVQLWAWPGQANNQAIRTVSTVANGQLGLTPGIVNDGIWYQAVKDDTGWRGWFSVCPVGKSTNRIDLDLAFPNGINWRDSKGNIRVSGRGRELHYSYLLKH